MVLQTAMCHIEVYIFLTIFFSANGVSEYLPDDCGRTVYDHRTEKIINGREANIGQYPWIVRLGIRPYYGLRFGCGGSLINRFYVISAAHCETKYTIVRVGEFDVTNDGQDCDINNFCGPPHQDIPIKNIMKHPNHCIVKKQNDFLLIEMEQPVTLNDFVQPICLPKEPIKHSEFYNSFTNMAGWGYTRQFPVTDAKRLMHMSAPIVNEDACVKIYKYDLLDNQWCISDLEERGPAPGDSGGPLSKSMIVNGTRRSFLFGVISYGKRIWGSAPSVHSDVSRFLDWIETKIDKA